tara:strand:+ start:12862 stop:13101 length:240 start_codon:yes stop_codon:yes gene_type:complete
MLEWFIIAMVYFKDTERVEIKKMELPFQSQQECKDYLANTPNIVNDIVKLEPTAVGASFKCFDENEVKKFKANRRTIAL